MHKKTKIVVISLMTFVLLTTTMFGAQNFSQEKNKNLSSDKKMEIYEYPITPLDNSTVWRTFLSHNEMLDACEIPDNLIDKMSTNALIETCLSYPLLGDIYAYNSLYEGLQKQIERFNGLAELIKRKDAGEKLCSYYFSLCLDDFLKTRTYPIITLNFLETLISHPEIIKNLNTETQNNLLKYSFEMISLKTNNFNEYFSTTTNEIIVCRILICDKRFTSLISESEIRDITNFIDYGIYLNDNCWEKLVGLINKEDLLK